MEMSLSSLLAGTASASTPVQLSTHNESTVPLNRVRLQELVKEVDPNEQLDEDVEEALLQIADDFIENVVSAACLLAKHRGSTSLDVKDVQLYLGWNVFLFFIVSFTKITSEKNWNLWIPGFGTEELRPYRKTQAAEAHRQRMALIRKSLKK